MKPRTRFPFYMQILLTVAVIFGCSLLYAVRMRDSGEEKALSTLSELSAQSVKLLNKEVEKEEKVLLNLADLLVADGDLDPGRIIDRLTFVDEHNSFKRMGLIVKGGSTYTTDHVSLDLSKRPYYQAAVEGKSVISDTLPDLADGDPITVYAVPLIVEGEVNSVLFATYSTTYYEHVLSATSFGGAGYSYVVKADGSCMVESAQPDTLNTYENTFERMTQEDASNEKTASFLRSELENGRTGSVIYTNLSGDRKYLYYEPLDINDWYLLTIVPVSVIQRDVNGSLILSYFFTSVCALVIVVLLLHTLTSRKRTQKELEKIAFVDPLTGGSTYDRFKRDFPDAYRQAGGPCAVAVMNLERFRLINDMYGYREGDSALRHVFAVLNGDLKDGELLARETADHFVMFLKYDCLPALTDRLLALYDEINSTRCYHGRYYELRPCFGIYEIIGPDTVDRLMGLAQLAAQSIKYDVFRHVAVYDEKLRQDLLDQKSLEDHFEDAVEKHEFSLCYQAKYDLKKGCYGGAEALVRWDSSHAGFLMPGSFIQIFERNGSIIRLDTYLFTELCRQVREWLDQGISVLPVSVNLSRMHLYRPEFIDEYLAIIREYRVPTDLIQIELTETALFDNDEVMIAILNRLRAHGIRILMDDFGSGYSSILMLKNLPIDILKIDKGLIDDLETSGKARIIVKNIIDLSHRLRLLVVAEGVENKEQADLLKEFDCDEIQGFYYAKPLPPKEYLELTGQTAAAPNRSAPPS